MMRTIRRLSALALALWAVLSVLAAAPGTAAPKGEPDLTMQPKLDVLLLVDTSSSMRGAPLTTAQQVAASYLRSLPQSVRAGVVTYGQFPTSMYRLSANRAGSLAALSALSVEGQAAANDGILFASDQFDLGSTSKRQIVVIGSGAETGSTSSKADTLGTLRQRSIRLDTITVDSPAVLSVELGNMAVTTGGATARWSDAPAIRKIIADANAWSTPPPPPAVSRASTSIFASKLVLGLGLTMIFGGLGVVAFFLTKPKPKKVDLIGVTEIKRSATPVSGIAERLSEVADRALEKQGRDRGLSVTLERAGVNLRPGEFLIVAFCSILGLFAFLSWWKGFTVAGIGTALFALIGPRKYLARKANKRSTIFGDQLSDTLQLLSSSLRAGQGLTQAIDSVAKEGDAPASDEFRRVLTEVRLGRDLIDALRAMADRVHSEDFNWVIPAIEINREVGGDLAEVLDTVAGTIRDRADIKRQVKTLSAEGRLSAYVLLSLPIGIAAFIQFSNPEYLSELQTSPGYYLAIAAVLMMVIGGVWLFKLCKIEF